MGKLITPFGEIDIMIDGQPVSYTAREGSKIKELCSDVLGRFQIAVHYIPDGKEHSIDDVGRNDPGGGNHNRDIQTWFGADPTVSL